MSFNRKFPATSKYSLILIVSILLIFVFSPLSAQTNNASSPKVESQDINSSIITLTKDIVNILFYVLMGILGILSYRQARRTIFTPLKTETFKLQLKVFENIFVYLDHHKKQQFIDSFDYRKILSINAALLFEYYIETFFKDEIQIDKERRKLMLAEVPMSNMAFKHIDKIKKINDGITLDLSNVNIDVQDPEERLSKWLKYEYIMIHFTVNFQNQMDQLDRFISSPLVPSKIRIIIQEFRVKAYQNLHAMAEVLTDVAKLLPEKYPSAESVTNAEDSWIWNMYTDKRFRLKNISDIIYQQINEHLSVDKLLK